MKGANSPGLVSPDIKTMKGNVLQSLIDFLLCWELLPTFIYNP